MSGGTPAAARASLIHPTACASRVGGAAAAGATAAASASARRAGHRIHGHCMLVGMAARRVRPSARWLAALLAAGCGAGGPEVRVAADPQDWSPTRIAMLPVI